MSVVLEILELFEGLNSMAFVKGRVLAGVVRENGGEGVEVRKMFDWGVESGRVGCLEFMRKLG